MAAETLLDVKGMNCPLPVLRANRALRGSVADFRSFCRETGHTLVSLSEEAGVFSFTIRRRPERDEEDPA